MGTSSAFGGQGGALGEASNLLASAQIQVEEAVGELNRFVDHFDADPERQQFLEERLDTIYTLARKHRIQPTELAALQQQLFEELEGLNADDQASERLAEELAAFVEGHVLPGTGVDADRFWSGYAGLLAEFSAENRALLQRRAELQSQIDAWHKARGNQPWDTAAYRAFLTEIGYLVPEPAPFAIDNGRIDPEIAQVAGPQLVVPVSNARFALNAANARWGSLYQGWLTFRANRLAMLGLIVLIVLIGMAVFAPWIAPQDAQQYIAGLILLGAAPCTAMVSPWIRSIMAPGEFCWKNRPSSVITWASRSRCMVVEMPSEIRDNSDRLATRATERSRKIPMIAPPTHQIAPVSLPTKTRSNSGFSIQEIRASVDPSAVIRRKAPAMLRRWTRR